MQYLLDAIFGIPLQPQSIDYSDIMKTRDAI